MYLRRLLPGLSEFAGTSIGFFVVLLLIRIYEYLLVRSAHVMPAGAAGLMIDGLRSDAALTLWLAAILIVPITALAQWSPRAAFLLHRCALVAMTLAGVALVQYFATTFVPLGADLFGYSWSDIRATTEASGGNKAAGIVALVVFCGLTWLVTGLSRKWPLGRRGTIAFYSAMLGSIVFNGAIELKPRSFSSDSAFYLAQNKTVFFAGRALGFVSASHNHPAPSVPLTGFPLLHEATYDDVLGPLLNAGAHPPNIVIILVEGLGRDFTGDGARYQGFTPFLDSLENRSLYWENFLSTSGRSFGALPSILGSLPFGHDGFMDLGARMPGHVTLVSLLRERGYQTSYYSGTDGHFDNIDVFLEREGIEQFVDQSKFGAGFEKQSANAEGFSWGFPDGEVFRRGLAGMKPAGAGPRLEIFATITSHEPFVPPGKDAYLAAFERRLALLHFADDRAAEFRKYAGVFSTLLYTDDAIRFFLAGYSKRADFANTIFFITGDHRLVPIPEEGRLDRYHVPLIVFSPMLKQARRISSVSSHLDITPSILALLHHEYAMSFPSKVSWLSGGLDTAQRFRNVHSLALMRTKNELVDFLDGDRLLSRGEPFTLRDGVTLPQAGDSRTRAELGAKLDRFREVNEFVTSGDHLYPGQAASGSATLAATRDDSLFKAMGLAGKTPDDVFKAAQQLAWKGDYGSAQLIAMALLRAVPNFHDARALLGRTYAWQHNYPQARITLGDLVKRAPEFLDGHVALADAEISSGRAGQALAAAEAGLKQFPKSGELLLRKAQALETLGRKNEALKALGALQAVGPSNATAAEMRRRLAR